MPNDEIILEESELLLEVVRSIVSQPEKVMVNSARGQQTTILTIQLDQEDYGQVIGKHGRTLAAIQHIFSKAASLDRRRTIIQLNDQEAFRKPRVERPFRENNKRREAPLRSPRYR